MEKVKGIMMDLITEAMEDTYIMDKRSVLNEYGGTDSYYEEGALIKVAYTLDTSTAARIAAQEGIKNRYTLTTRKAVILKAPDVLKRVRDGKIFRVTSDGSDNNTPDSAGLDIRQVEAEEWVIPKGDS